MRVVYKAFSPGFVCRGVAFKPPGEVNVTPSANCVRNGWHTAENPADCLSYYPDITKSWYCLVAIGGDVDEDASDTKIAATELTILRRLTLPEYFLHVLVYMAKHADEYHPIARQGRAEAANGYVVVKGRSPYAKGQEGDILAMAREGEDGKLEQIAVYVVGTDGVPVGTYIDIDGNIEEEKVCKKAKKRASNLTVCPRSRSASSSK